MTPTARHIAERLSGTADSLVTVLEYYGAAHLQDDAAFCEELDSLVFECSVCNWWHDQSEMSKSEDWVCEDCSDE